jgi:hypothetical protein
MESCGLSAHRQRSDCDHERRVLDGDPLFADPSVLALDAPGAAIAFALVPLGLGGAPEDRSDSRIPRLAA